MVHPYVESWVPSCSLHISKQYIELELFHFRMGVAACKCEGRNHKESIDKFKFYKISKNNSIFVCQNPTNKMECWSHQSNRACVSWHLVLYENFKEL
jgi:hypothetical protein